MDDTFGTTFKKHRPAELTVGRLSFMLSDV